MSISVAWGGKNWEKTRTFFKKKMRIFLRVSNLQLWRPRELLLFELLQVTRRHTVHDAHAKLRKEKTKIRMFWRFIFTLWPWCLDPSRAPPACFTFLATVTMHVATYLIKSTKLYETTNSSRHVTGLTGLKTYWVLQFLQVTTSTTQEDSHVNLSLSFTPCNRWWCTKGRKCKNCSKMFWITFFPPPWMPEMVLLSTMISHASQLWLWIA